MTRRTFRIIHCNRCGCEEEMPVQGWYEVYMRGDEEEDGVRCLDFCSLKCLQEWANSPMTKERDQSYGTDMNHKRCGKCGKYFARKGHSLTLPGCTCNRDGGA